MAIAGSTSLGLDPSNLLLYNKGPLVLKPQFSVSETYNDNIFYAPTDTESDFITTFSPGIQAQLGSKDYNYVNLSYTYDRLQYAQNSEQSANQHRIALGSYFQHSRLTLSGRDEIEFLSTPLGGGISIGGGKVDRRTWVDEYRLDYDLSEKTSPYVEFLHSDTDFESGVALYDSSTYQGTLGFGYRAFSQTTIFGELYYGHTQNEANPVPGPQLAPYPGTDYIGGFLGVRGNFTEKMTGTVKAGYESRSYDTGADSSGLPVVEMSLTEQFTEKTILTVSYSRRQRESVQIARTAYTSQVISANLLQHIGNEGRFRANLKAAYLMADYEPSPAYSPDRKDNIINAGIDFSYDIKIWMRAFLGYDFEHLDSTTVRVFEYDVNRVTAGLSFGY